MDKIRNQSQLRFGQFGDKVREARMRWFGHVLKRDSAYIQDVADGKEEDHREEKHLLCLDYYNEKLMTLI